MTRSQTRKPERTIKPLRVSSQVKINVKKDKFQEAKITDKSLSRLFDKAHVYFPDADRNPLTSWYGVDDELLYHLSNNTGQTELVKKLTVPVETEIHNFFGCDWYYVLDQEIQSCLSFTSLVCLFTIINAVLIYPQNCTQRYIRTESRSNVCWPPRCKKDT